MDGFQNFKWRLETEKILQNLYRIDFLNFCPGEFCFQFEFFFYFDFPMHETHLKSFVFKILLIGDYS